MKTGGQKLIEGALIGVWGTPMANWTYERSTSKGAWGRESPGTAGRRLGRVEPGLRHLRAQQAERTSGWSMVPIEYAELGTELEVETPQERTIAPVVEKPFCKPEKAEQQLSTLESERQS
jgi:hypothetical protein